MYSRVPASFERSSVRALVLALGGRGGKSLRLRISPNEVSLSLLVLLVRDFTWGLLARRAALQWSRPTNPFPGVWSPFSGIALQPLSPLTCAACKKRASAMCETSQVLSFCIACVTLVYGPIFLSWAFHLKSGGPFKDLVALLPKEPEDSKLSPVLHAISISFVLFSTDSGFPPK